MPVEASPCKRRIALLGGLDIQVNGEAVPIDAWHRSKAKALVKLLALSPDHRRHREVLMDSLWPNTEPEAAAASLRKAIHHVRQALGADAVLVHDDLVELNPDGLWVDVDAYENAIRSNDARQALALYRADLLPEDTYEPWVIERREQLRSQAIRILFSHAIELEHDGKTHEAIDALERLVALDPLNEEGFCGLIRLQGAAGDRAAALRWYGRLESSLRKELGLEPGPRAKQLRSDVLAGRMPGASYTRTLVSMPAVHYAQSGGLNIAYQVFGNGPIDLVYVMGWVTHLGFMWHQPMCVRFFERLAEFSRVLIFDKRGTGMSDRVPVDSLPGLEQRMDDVRAVMDAAGSRRAAIFGVSEGGPMAMLFAATYPERTRALILYGTYARRLQDSDYPWAPTQAQRERFYETIQKGWGGPVDSAALAPSMAGDDDFSNWWARYCQMAVTPAAALALARMNSEVDVRNILPSIRVPTLVIHRREDYESIGGAYFIAEHIPGARMIVLPGADHYIYAGNQGEILEPIESFLSELGEPAVRDSVLATIVSIEVQGADAERDRLHRFAVEEVSRYRGRLLAGGNRIVAAFDGPARAIRLAQAIVTMAAQIGITARAGIHTGECEVLGEQLRGSTLAQAGEISAAAGPCEVLVSETVTNLVSGSGLAIQKRATAKASPSAGALFSVRFTPGERSEHGGRTTTP